MNKMKNKLTEKEICMVRELAKEIREEANEGLSIKENLEISLAARIEGVDEKKEVEELCQGIQEFDELLKQMEQGGKELIVEKLNQSGLGDKAIEEQYALLAEVLEGGLKALTGNPDYDLGELSQFSIKKDGEVTEEELEQAKIQVASYLDEFALLHGEAVAMESLLSLLGEEAMEELQEALGKEEETYYMALAIYILQMEGKLEGIGASMGAKGIGASIAAAIASAKARAQGLLGRLSKEKVLEALRKIAAAALTILVTIAIAAAAVTVAQLVFSVSAVLLGYGVLGFLAAAALAVGSGVEVTEALLQWKEDAVELVGEAREFAAEKYRVVKQWVMEAAIPAWKRFWDCLKNKAASFQPEAKPAETDQEADEEQMEQGAVAEA